MVPSYTLVGTELSLYTGKARAYLQWRGVPFREVMASDGIYRNLIKPYAHINMIPVLVVQDSAESEHDALVIQDTKAIMDYIEARASSFPQRWFDHPVIPASPRRAFAAMLLELLADDWLVMQAMYWRWWEPHYKRQAQFLAYEFGYGDGSASADDMLRIGSQRMKPFRGFLGPLGVSAATAPALEWQFRELLRLMTALLERHPFLLGRQVSVADFAFFGPFHAHLTRDPVPGFIIQTEAPVVFEWVERVRGLQRYAGGNTYAFDHDRPGVLRPTYGQAKRAAEGGRSEIVDDSLPEQVLPMVHLLLRDFLPVLDDTIRRTLEYLESKRREGTEKVTLPRMLGGHKFSLHTTVADDGPTAQGQRGVYTHAIWTLDRIRVRAAHWPSQIAAVEDCVTQVGGPALAQQFRADLEQWRGGGWVIEREKNQLIARKVDQLARRARL